MVDDMVGVQYSPHIGGGGGGDMEQFKSTLKFSQYKGFGLFSTLPLIRPSVLCTVAYSFSLSHSC